jgi:hypothetical protein
MAASRSDLPVEGLKLWSPTPGVPSEVIADEELRSGWWREALAVINRLPVTGRSRGTNPIRSAVKLRCKERIAFGLAQGLVEVLLRLLR